MGYGLLWGLVAYGITLVALLEVAARLGEGVAGFFYALLFLLYFAVSSAVWFMITHALQRYSSAPLRSWCLTTVLYFFWMSTVSLYPLCGYWYGYPLACPLLPLCAHTSSSASLPGVVTSKLDFSETMPHARICEIQELLRSVISKNKSAVLLVLPESTFPFALNYYQYAVDDWSDVLQDKYLVLGSHFQDEEGRLYNSAYVIHQGQIVHRYDKQRLLPFFEESTWLHSPFFKGKRRFNNAQKDQPAFVIPGIGAVSFRICSELLWDMPANSTVIALVNDSYYRFAYFSRLFRKHAECKALEKGSRLLYCGWRD